MSDDPPVIPPKAEKSKTGKLVDGAFILGLGSIVCGVTTVPAIIQSIRALICLHKEKSANKSAISKVVFSLIWSSCILGFIIFCVASALYGAQAIARHINCVNHMKELGLAMRVYVSDNDDRFPQTNWCDVILKNGIGRSGILTNLPTCFHCPSTSKSQRCGYAMNRQLVGTKDAGQIEEDTVVLFESDAGWNAVGGPEIIADHHSGLLNVTFVDGSVQAIHKKDIPHLRWNPYTNSPAK